MGEPLRHEGWVYAVSFSPDGQRIVTASADSTARIWDAENEGAGGRTAHEADVRSANFSADGNRIVTASFDNTASDLGCEDRAEQMGERCAMKQDVNYASFSPDGARVVTACSDYTARIWDAKTGKEVRELPHEAPVGAASFSPDGTRIVTASDDKTARIWDAKTGQQLGEPLATRLRLTRPPSARTAVELSPPRMTRQPESGTLIPARSWANHCAIKLRCMGRASVPMEHALSPRLLIRPRGSRTLRRPAVGHYAAP